MYYSFFQEELIITFSNNGKCWLYSVTSSNNGRGRFEGTEASFSRLKKVDVFVKHKHLWGTKNGRCAQFSVNFRNSVSKAEKVVNK